MNKLENYNNLFWFCCTLAFLNIVMANVCGVVSQLHELTNLFLGNAALFAVGALAHYMNIRQEESKKK